jgi:tetratricopeptide (TPR) repeat protein
MRAPLFGFVQCLAVPLAAPLWAQSAANPHDPAPSAKDGPDQVPDLQLLTPPKGDSQGDAQDKAPALPNSSLPGAKPHVAARAPSKPPETEEQLLAKLAKAPDKRSAHALERQLAARWSHSPSPSADLLLKRTDQAIEAHNLDIAREIATKLTAIAPDFAEAWHHRARLASEKDDYDDALLSLRHVLSLQPKQFNALAELGEILEEFNDKPHALEAYRQAKALDPFIDGIDDRITTLSKSVEGQGI